MWYFTCQACGDKHKPAENDQDVQKQILAELQSLRKDYSSLTKKVTALESTFESAEDDEQDQDRTDDQDTLEDGQDAQCTTKQLKDDQTLQDQVQERLQQLRLLPDTDSDGDNSVLPKQLSQHTSQGKNSGRL